MKIEKLSDRLQTVIHNLRHNSSTIQDDVIDALEDATNEEEFVEMGIRALDQLKHEVMDVREELENKTITIEVERGCVVDVRDLPKGWNYELIDHDVEDGK